VPAIRLEHLSEAQAKAYMLADNKLTDRSSWDDRKVAIVLKELSDIALDFEIEATGFEPPEIDLRIQSLEPPDESTDAADEFEALEGPPVSRLDDLWTLGNHRLLCGSALEFHAYGVLLAGEKATAIFTDPPYNVRVKGHVSGKGARKHREFPMAAGELTEDEFRRFLVDAFGLMASHSVDGATLFACMDWRHLLEIAGAVRAVDCELLNLCVWVKTNGGMGSLYRSRHELVFVFGKRDATRINNVQLGKHGRNRTNVWNYPGMNSFARRGRARGLDFHPTVKPIAMVSDAILDVTHRGDIVLDPFCGSGTTILAAERTGRRGYAIELDPGHVDTAIALLAADDEADRR
jgi:DNA modification methylase